MPKFIVTIGDLLPPHTVSLYILEQYLTAFYLRIHYFVTDKNTATF